MNNTEQIVLAVALLVAIVGAEIIFIPPPRRQAGYVITSKMDTVSGIIQNIGTERIKFKPAEVHSSAN